jgi:hypothetical protein
MRVIRPAGDGPAASRVTALAMDVPARGPEAAAWRVRGLAESTLQALTLQELATGMEAPLLAAVDVAAATILAAPFADRLVELRRYAGPVPAGYPAPCPPAPPAPPPRAVVEAAQRLAALLDTVTAGMASWPGTVGSGAVNGADPACGSTPNGGTASSGPQAGRGAGTTWPASGTTEPAATQAAGEAAVPLEVSTVAADLDRLAAIRPFGRLGHACRRLAVDPRLVWRGWLLLEETPVFCVPAQPLTPTAAAMMFGLHVGVHLDHLAELSAARGPAIAARLQFGAGLLVAESVAMAVELSLLADPANALGASERRFLAAAAVDRLSRLPGIANWGRRAAPDSPAMAAACAAASAGSPAGSARLPGGSARVPGGSAGGSGGSAGEFAALPTLAAAYVAGPFQLAARGFEHPLVPAEVWHALVARWAAVERAEQAVYAAPAGRPCCLTRRSRAARRTRRALERRFGRRGGGRR